MHAMTCRKKSGVAIWVTVIIVTLAYPLSLGPACWLSVRARSGGLWVHRVFQPLLTLGAWTDAREQPSHVALIHWYINLGTPKNTLLLISDGGNLPTIWVHDVTPSPIEDHRHG